MFWAARAPVIKRRNLQGLLFFFLTLVTGPRRSLRLELSDTRVYEPQARIYRAEKASSHSAVVGVNTSRLRSLFATGSLQTRAASGEVDGTRQFSISEQLLYINVQRF